MGMSLGGQTNVLFTAELAQDRTITHGTIIRFDNVLTNIGAHYHGQEGIFECPFDAFFAFTWTIKTREGRVKTELVRKDDVLQIGPFAEEGRGTSSMTTVVKCIQGQGIWVRAIGWPNPGSPVNLRKGYSSFTGYLINEESSITPLVAANAHLSENKQFYDGQNVVFNNVALNVDNPYHPQSGTFRCVKPGLYAVAVSHHATVHRVRSHVMLNDSIDKYGPHTSDKPGDSGTSSNMNFITCSQDSLIKVRALGNGEYEGLLNTFTAFSMNPDVIFTATMSKPNTISDGGAIIFDKVGINQGSGYDGYSGHFKCPFDGDYFFTWSVQAEEGQAEAALVINGDVVKEGPVASIDCYEDKESGTSSMQGTWHCEKDDNIWVKAVGSTGKIHFSKLTSFSGFSLPLYIASSATPRTTTIAYSPSKGVRWNLVIGSSSLVLLVCITLGLV